MIAKWISMAIADKYDYSMILTYTDMNIFDYTCLSIHNETTMICNQLIG